MSGPSSGDDWRRAFDEELRQHGSRTRGQVPGLVLETADVVHLAMVIVFVGYQMP